MDWRRPSTPFVAEGFDLSLCLLDYPREDLCDQSTWLGAEKGFVRAIRETGARSGVLSTFSDTISEPVAARLLAEGIVPLAGIDTGIARSRRQSTWATRGRPHRLCRCSMFDSRRRSRDQGPR